MLPIALPEHALAAHAVLEDVDRLGGSHGIRGRQGRGRSLGHRHEDDGKDGERQHAHLMPTVPEMLPFHAFPSSKVDFTWLFNGILKDSSLWRDAEGVDDGD